MPQTTHPDQVQSCEPGECTPSHKTPESHPSASDVPYVYGSSVAICTLADDALNQELLNTPLIQEQGIMVASLRTENLGIEQIIEFCLNQPKLRVIILCGKDARQAIGYRPGQSMVALLANGINECHRIIGAEGKRPVLKNLTESAIDHFRKTVAVVDLVDQSSLEVVLKSVKEAIEKQLPLAEPYPGHLAIKAPILRYLATAPTLMVSDPSGYFVIEVQPCQLAVTHYQNDGRISGIVEGPTAKAVYCKAIELGWVSQLDHAAYLGKELTKAELSLKQGSEYIQDQD